MTIQDIYRILDAYAPFALQESYDKSGLLVGDPQKEVRKILLTLDITVPVVEEAAAIGADLILAHHPVIWEPLRSISPDSPVWKLVQHNIGAICSHTCLDIAEGGLNDYIGKLIGRKIPLYTPFRALETLPGERVLGRVADLALAPYDADGLAAHLNDVFRCGSLRYYRGKNADTIKTVAWCTGSGGDLISAAIAAGADALITGDCKHSVWAEAQNRDFTLFDCGHFETEVPVTLLFRKILKDAAPEIETVISKKGTAPFFTSFTPRGAAQNTCYTYFRITGSFDPDVITAALGIQPEKVHRVGELRKNGTAYDFAEWTCGRCERYSPDVSEMMLQTISSLRGKTEILKQLKEQYDLYYSLEIVPTLSPDAAEAPCLSPSQPVTLFCANTGTEFDIDLYYS